MDFVLTMIQHYGLLAVFLNVFIEGVGLPIPSYPILMIAAASSGTENYQPLQLLLTGVGAAMLADIGWYSGGRYYGARIVGLLCKISLSPDTCVRSTGMMFTRVGAASLSFTKFIPGFANVAIVLAGVRRTPLKAFLFYDALGEIIFIGSGVLLGKIFHNAVSDVLGTLTQLGHIGLLVVAIAMAAFLLNRWWKRKQLLRQLHMDRITPGELYALIDKGEKPVIVDVRPPETRHKEGSIPGSIYVNMMEFEPLAKRYPPETEMVIYCSCPNEASAATVARHLKKAGFHKIRPLQGGPRGLDQSWLFD